MFQNKLRGSYITQLHKKNQQFFGTQDIGPLDMVFKPIDFKPLVFGSFGEMSSNGKEYIKLAVDYEAEHPGRAMDATTVEVVKTALRRRYINHLSAVNWRGLANLVLDRNKYVGTGHTWLNRARIRQGIIDIGDVGRYFRMWIAH